MPRFIPKVAFQIIAVAALIACFIYLIQGYFYDQGLYRIAKSFIGEQRPGISISVTFIMIMLVYFPLMIVLRRFSTIPRLSEETELSAKELFDSLSKKNETGKMKIEQLATSESFQSVLEESSSLIGFIFLVAGVIFLIGAWAVDEMFEVSRYTWMFEMGGYAVGVMFFLLGLYTLITGKLFKF